MGSHRRRLGAGQYSASLHLPPGERPPAALARAWSPSSPVAWRSPARSLTGIAPQAYADATGAALATLAEPAHPRGPRPARPPPRRAGRRSLPAPLHPRAGRPVVGGDLRQGRGAARRRGLRRVPDERHGAPRPPAHRALPGPARPRARRRLPCPACRRRARPRPGAGHGRRPGRAGLRRGGAGRRCAPGRGRRLRGASVSSTRPPRLAARLVRARARLEPGHLTGLAAWTVGNVAFLRHDIEEGVREHTAAAQQPATRRRPAGLGALPQGVGRHATGRRRHRGGGHAHRDRRPRARPGRQHQRPRRAWVC
nr:hypothetical protein [Nocardioides convexus]